MTHFEDIVADAIERGAAAAGVDVVLFASLCYQESTGRMWAWNPEPRYPYVWNVRTWAPFRKLTAAELISSIPPADFAALSGDADQEWWGQKASWGVAQVMGAVAREQGFRGPFLTELCDPMVGALFGARHLYKYLKRWGDVDGVSAYNWGSPTTRNEEAYVKPILRRAEEWRREGGWR